MHARPLRLALVGSTGVCLLLAGGAAAAPAKPKPVCNLVQDAENDTFLVRAQDTAGAFGPQEDAMDIVSADLASDAKTLTGVIRVKDLAAATATSPGGVSYDINFTTPDIDSPVYIRAFVPGSGDPVTDAGTRESVVVTSLATSLGEGTAVVDEAKNEVRFSFPLAHFTPAGGLKPGAKLTFGDVTTGRALNSGRAVFADVATSDKTYTVGAPSCVAPGK
jgi:hypothetical protein